ncbi:hypothetical protein H0H92_011633 [Tricholoma furcatifolium]|nr:hypothetical protein H0H92_011633 [Tricholoma furcatifolium]
MPSTKGPINSLTPSKSRSLIPVGPRTVASSRGKHHGVRDENGERPTTVRAMVLRNGKYGARGTGEMILTSKLSGREKLDLLAGFKEDLVQKSKTAIMTPFRLQQCLKIAESQCDAYLDDIANLRDPQLFMYLIQAELNARTNKDKTKKDPLKDASFVASIVATKIHNTFMLASAWKLVCETLAQLAVHGVTDASIKSQLKNNQGLRARYLVLYDLVNDLINISQSKFSVLATTAPHYARYFKVAPDQSNEPEPDMMFDWQELREACVSFLDSIIIELCFPCAPYPKEVLYQILRDAVDESPKEAKRFPQALWDAVGDLSVAVELQQILATPLTGSEGQDWIKEPRTMPVEYEKWVDAQIFSQQASTKYANFKDHIFPLEKTKTKTVLENMWKYINLNYKVVSGEDINMLWRLNDEFNPTPQWHSFYMPDLDSDDDSDSKPSRPGFRGKKSAPKRLAITDGPADDSDGSMPELQSVSNSSEEESEYDDSDEEFESDSDESGYDTEEEDELRELLREAMDTAHEADWQHSAQVSDAEMDPFAQDRKGNPFLKLLGSLRGRMFSSSPKLKTAIRTVPLSQKVDGKIPETKSAPPTKITPSEPKSQRATVEEVEDEDEVIQAKKKKKKKKKPKKKKSAPSAGPAVDSDEEDEMQESPAIPPALPTSKPTPTVTPKSPTVSAVKKAAPKVTLASKTLAPQASTTSLPFPTESVAQSARAYLAETLNTQKAKVKSRPGFGTAFSGSDNKSGIFSKFFRRATGAREEKPEKGAKHSWFTRLGKKSKSLMHQLLNTSEGETKGITPMKWEDFLRIMRDMGFEYEPGTAGSSVRFDPPDKRDKPITFHKPHPDPTLQPTVLKIYAKRLKERYGWTEEDFIRQTEA